MVFSLSAICQRAVFCNTLTGFNYINPSYKRFSFVNMLINWLVVLYLNMLDTN